MFNHHNTARENHLPATSQQPQNATLDIASTGHLKTFYCQGTEK